MRYLPENQDCKGFLQKTHWYGRAQSGKFGDLITADHKVLGGGCESRHIHRYFYLRNVTDLLSDGKTPYERRFGVPSNGPVIPFGAMVEYHPVSAKDQSRLHQFGLKFLPGFFLGCVLYWGKTERRHVGRMQ